ncbi:MAG TPA: discoidin domain-containing protein, partial [Flavisolibacter sp.]
WKTGEWQSYFDQDLEAVVDLGQSRKVNYVGIHVLQDVSPWILFPKELIIYTSMNGKDFTEAGRTGNSIPPTMQNVQTQVMGVKLYTRARYIKIKATSGGKLPGWHESAGEPSHLFIDEIIVK